MEFYSALQQLVLLITKHMCRQITAPALCLWVGVLSMNIEEQTCSLELSRRLKELGVKQNSLYIWVLNKEDHPKSGWSVFANSPYVKNHLRWEDQSPAFTVAELGQILPWFIENNSKTYWYGTGKTRKEDKYYHEHEIHYSDDCKVICLERGITEADARAYMIIHLLENKLMELPE